VNTGTPCFEVDAFVFDIGNVLVEFDFGPAYEAISEKSVLKKGGKAVEDALDPIKRVYEDGGMGRAEFMARSFELLGYQGTAAEFQRTWENIFTINAQMESVLRGLSGRYPLFLLSNTNDLHRDFLFSQFPVFGLFQAGIYSYEVRVSKPEPEIFEITRERFGLNPARTLFVDDLAANVESARRLGFRCHRYARKAHGEFLEELKRVGANLDHGQ
jgi:FMN phosphatase YigB (HAD superfamily)